MQNGQRRLACLAGPISYPFRHIQGLRFSPARHTYSVSEFQPPTRSGQALRIAKLSITSEEYPELPGEVLLVGGGR